MSSSRSTYSRMSSSRFSRGKAKTTKHKYATSFSSNTKSTMKKAALVGVGAYAGHKLAKVSSKFNTHVFIVPGHSHWSEGDFQTAAAADKNFLCRSNSDCSWLDEDLECHEMSLSFTPSSLWFGGDVVNIRGKCQCQDNFWWDDDDLQCQMFWEEETEDEVWDEGGGSGGVTTGYWFLDIIVSIILCCIVYCCFAACCG